MQPKKTKIKNGKQTAISTTAAPRRDCRRVFQVRNIIYHLDLVGGVGVIDSHESMSPTPPWNSDFPLLVSGPYLSNRLGRLDPPNTIVFFRKAAFCLNAQASRA